MAFNLQNAEHGDLRTVFERSEHEWLDYEAINAIFRSREELTVSTQPVHPIQEGLYLYATGATLDLIDWDYDIDTDVSQALNGPIPIEYTVVRCDDFDIEGGVKITLERRLYETDIDDMFCVAHYRAFHNREDNSSDSGGDNDGIEAGEDDNTTENAGDYVYVVDRAAHLAAAKAAWAMDLGRNPDTSDVAPVAAKAIVCQVEATYGSQVLGGTQRDAESPVYISDAEEELIRAAIEASKKDFQEGRHNTRYTLDNDRSTVLSPRASINCQDKDISCGLLTSLEPRSSSMQDKRGGMKQKQPSDTSSQHGHDLQNINASYPEEPGSSSVQDTREDMKQKLPIGTSSLHRHDNQNGEASYPKEWGGIPTKELQEAIMLEKALFSGVAKESASHNIQPGNLIQSQSPDKRTVGEEPERSSTTKKAALPIEPSVENEDAITPLVRMPDSSRHGRRFLKTDKLKNLFDFIDAAGLVKPGTYRVVRSYPQRAFSLQDGALSFEELSLTNKEEVLLLEPLV